MNYTRFVDEVVLFHTMDQISLNDNNEQVRIVGCAPVGRSLLYAIVLLSQVLSDFQNYSTCGFIGNRKSAVKIQIEIRGNAECVTRPPSSAALPNNSNDRHSAVPYRRY